MKRSAIFLAVYAHLLSAAVAADAVACYAIADQDQRTYCLAKAHGEASICYGIQRSDLRAQCRAEVQR